MTEREALLLDELAAEHGLSREMLIERSLLLGDVVEDVAMRLVDVVARDAESAFYEGRPVPEGSDRKREREQALLRVVKAERARRAQEGGA